MVHTVTLEEFKESAEFNLGIAQKFGLVVTGVSAHDAGYSDIRIEALSDETPKVTKTKSLFKPQGFVRGILGRSGAFATAADGGLQEVVRGEVVKLSFMMDARPSDDYDGEGVVNFVTPQPVYKLHSVICYKADMNG